MTNLYVAGSSVFPTAGANFPTITIVALTLRLSEHIAKEMKSANASVSKEVLIDENLQPFTASVDE